MVERPEDGAPDQPAPGSSYGGRRLAAPGPDEIAACIATLEALRDVDPDDPAYVAVERAAAHLRKSAKKKRRVARKHESRAVDREELAQTGRVQAYYGTRSVTGEPTQRLRESRPPVRSEAPDGTEGRRTSGQQRPFLGEPSAGEVPARMLRNQRRCYVCKQPYRRVHGFYHMLCTTCAERNFAARNDAVDLGGRRAIVTGGRVKIGFLAAVGLLRAGAHVTVTTRFPRDAEARFAACEEIEGCRDRLSIVGLDFLDLRAVLGWIGRELEGGEPLDILINNAAQTVRRPHAYYAALAAAERGQLPAAVEDAQALLFPAGVDEEGKPRDLRPVNSWVLDAVDVEPVELVEVHLVNAMVPFLLASRLRPLMVKSRFADRYIVNVSAMEGVFAYANKQSRHPHTNMAKAALNMFTRTSAQDYVADGIYMNSVDTGWITQENPEPKKVRAEAAGFCPPLDIVDGAARVLAPILRGVRGAPVAGAFFKDYEPAPW